MGASSGTMPPRASRDIFTVLKKTRPLARSLEKLVMLTPTSQLGIETDARTPQTLESLGIGYSPRE